MNDDYPRRRVFPSLSFSITSPLRPSLRMEQLGPYWTDIREICIGEFYYNMLGKCIFF
jgi:hypothetical protein